jgi:hypothetical protein
VSRRAQLISDAGIRQCLLQDISRKGFLVLTNEQYALGEELELACELQPQQVLKCKIQVRHVDDTCIGTLIVEISPDAASLLERFLKEQYEHKLENRAQAAPGTPTKATSNPGSPADGDDLDFTKES